MLLRPKFATLAKTGTTLLYLGTEEYLIGFE